MMKHYVSRKEIALTAAVASPPPIALQPDEGEALAFLGILVTIKAGHDSTAGRVTVIEHHAPAGFGSPLHVHRREDEWFYVLEGELTFWVGGRVIAAPAGSFVYGPRDVPHTFEVTSPEARFLLVAEPAGFDAFVREVAGHPSPDPKALAATAAEYGIEILGPPGLPA
jgi:quercetin dioxygenase-like cupin family protein